MKQDRCLSYKLGLLLSSREVSTKNHMIYLPYDVSPRMKTLFSPCNDFCNASTTLTASRINSSGNCKAICGESQGLSYKVT